MSTVSTVSTASTASTAAPAVQPSTRSSVLRQRNFARLAISLATSQAGDWIYNVALLALVYERTHSSAWVSATTAARVLPIVVLGPLGGLVAARFDRRLTMITCDVLRAALMLLLVAVAVWHWPVVLVAGVAALATAVSAPYPSCAAATVLRIVPDADLPAANAVRAALGPLCVVVGPLVGALLFALGSADLAFSINAASFVVSAIALAGLPAAAGRCSARPDTHPRLVAELRDGAAALWQHRLALRLVGADVLCSFVYGVETVTLLIVSSRIGLSASGYGLLLAGLGAGGVLGAGVAARLAMRAAQARIVAVGLVAVAVPVALFGLVSAVAAALLLAVVVGAGATVVEVAAELALQRNLDDAVYAQAYGLAFPASIGAIVVGAAIAAPLVAAVGLTATFTLVAVLVAGYAGWLLAARPGPGVTFRRQHSRR